MEKYLVSYEYGGGTVWGFVAADGSHEVVAFLPEVDIWDDPPPSMTTAEFAHLNALAPIQVDAANALDALLRNQLGMSTAYAS